MEDYFKEVLKKLDTMSDEEFDNLLIKAGIEKCPFDKEGECILSQKKSEKD